MINSPSPLVYNIVLCSAATQDTWRSGSLLPLCNSALQLSVVHSSTDDQGTRESSVDNAIEAPRTGLLFDK